MPQRFNIKRVLIATAVAVLVGGAAIWFSGVIPSRLAPPQNSIMVIAPYRYNGTWAFDDPRFGLVGASHSSRACRR